MLPRRSIQFNSHKPFNTLVGDMGTVLSGGERQRVLLARALYKRPKILVLDEATSHLDIERGRSVNQAIRALQMTRLIIAHRPETVAMGDRRIMLMRGCVAVAGGKDVRPVAALHGVELQGGAVLRGSVLSASTQE